ncbi:hypothetical protein AVEN_207319-1 [Araneus ventricosus]|uniref:DUF5641 domain-containing protein n=1 Tax=Araneus ventricosus TaxID=182803 RepID=A0A4Y2P4D6_ARAVE|nr:hypothetical protein AVEN_207319-1 [Araneus ventricosus]
MSWCQGDKYTFDILRNQQALLDSFWRRRAKEYLLNLRNYHEVRNTDKQYNIREVDVVLLREEHPLRQVWKRVLVLKLIVMGYSENVI